MLERWMIREEVLSLTVCFFADLKSGCLVLVAHVSEADVRFDIVEILVLILWNLRHCYHEI